MVVVSFLALAVQVEVPPAYAGNDDGRLYLWIALVVGLLALGAALMLARAVVASDTGAPEMRAISDAIREGAEAEQSEATRCGKGCFDNQFWPC